MRAHGHVVPFSCAPQHLRLSHVALVDNTVSRTRQKGRTFRRAGIERGQVGSPALGQLGVHARTDAARLRSFDLLHYPFSPMTSTGSEEVCRVAPRHKDTAERIAADRVVTADPA